MMWAHFKWWPILFLVPGLALFLRSTYQWRKKRLQSLIDAPLWPEVLPGWEHHRLLPKGILWVLAFTFVLVALLRPQWGYELKEVHRKGVDIFVLVDVSNSMLVEDIKPNRLERAKRELKDLLDYLHGDRIGLIPFAGKAYVACPLTSDHEVFSLFTDELDTELIPTQGTNMEEAFQKALEGFGSSPSGSRTIILMTDGESTSGAWNQVVERVQKEEVKVFVMGFGTEAGGPIPESSGGGFKKDENGGLVISRLDEDFLENLAKQTGGTYVQSTTDDRDIDLIYKQGIKKVTEEQEFKSDQKRIPLERFQIPLGLGFILFLIIFLLPDVSRMGKMFLAVFILGSLFSTSSHAFAPWEAQKGNRYYLQNKYDKAEEEYLKALSTNQSPRFYYNLGNSYYREGKFLEAEGAYLKSLDSPDASLREKALYNLGNTHYRQEHLKEALDFYEKALKSNPKNTQAKLNHDFVKKLLEEQKNQENKEEEKNDQEQKDNKDSSSNNQEEKEDQKKSGDSSQPENKNSSENQKKEEAEQKKENETKQNEGEEKKDEQKQNMDHNPPSQTEGGQGEQNDGAMGKSGSGSQGVSQKEAQRRLDSLEDTPGKSLREMIQKDLGRHPRQPEKDW
ncbi:MAG TPA: hypothetical protein DDW49_08280 [Deltaproteobacteria bacterium]|nr:MAG: hypothetical protein A2048_07895 [Deltaproteobacteria bacterium GWA2_45_12]HBF13361.1 hypothetical protein [Deltaproteobacteria bacterium]